MLPSECQPNPKRYLSKEFSADSKQSKGVGL